MKTGNWKPTVFLEETCGEKKGGNGCVLLLVWEMASPLDTLLFHVRISKTTIFFFFFFFLLYSSLVIEKNDYIMFHHFK